MHMNGIYKLLCQFRMRKSVVATQDFKKHECHENDANSLPIISMTTWYRQMPSHSILGYIWAHTVKCQVVWKPHSLSESYIQGVKSRHLGVTKSDKNQPNPTVTTDLGHCPRAESITAVCIKRYNIYEYINNSKRDIGG